MTLREALMRKGIEWRNGANNHISICCMFCQERGETADNRFRLSINLSTGASFCFNCHFAVHQGFKTILRKLDWAFTLDGEEETKEQEREAPHLPEDFQCLDHTASDLDECACRYLRGRGITEEQVAKKRIGISLAGRYGYRVVFPSYYEKELIGFVARDFTGNQEPKYLNSFGKKGFYNTPRKAGRAILSEGVFKALRIERLATGFASMALLGRSITPFQIEQLHAIVCKEVILWPDPDLPGRKGAVEIANTLQEQGFIVGVIWPVYQSADEQPLQAMLKTWQGVQGFTWALQQRLILG